MKYSNIYLVPFPCLLLEFVSPYWVGTTIRCPHHILFLCPLLSLGHNTFIAIHYCALRLENNLLACERFYKFCHGRPNETKHMNILSPKQTGWLTDLTHTKAPSHIATIFLDLLNALFILYAWFVMLFLVFVFVGFIGLLKYLYIHLASFPSALLTFIWSSV